MCAAPQVIGAGYKKDDYSELALKRDHYNRPLWVCSDGRIFLETYSPIYKQVHGLTMALLPVLLPFQQQSSQEKRWKAAVMC